MLEKWDDHFCFRNGFSLREGQKSAFQIAHDIAAAVMAIVYPTGYGKTLAEYGIYSILRGRGIVDRLLILVPQDEQRTQAVRSCKRVRNDLGVAIKDAIAIEKVPRELRYTREGRAEVFVASYQQVAMQDGFFETLMENKRWMVVFDEAHHLADDAVWGPAAHKLPAVFRLFMSATPIRSDAKLIIGMPTTVDENGQLTFKADVNVTYQAAIEEKAIKVPRGHIQHYFIDVMVDGSDAPQRIETKDLLAEDVKDFSAYEAKKGLRYNNKFLSRILSDSISRLCEKKLQHPGQHQALAFAMSCRHAESVCEHFNLIAPGCADWIGVSRSDKDNAAVIRQFLDNSLDVLVQVDKLGEGFDLPRISVLIFLNLIQAEAKLFQQIGRGMRRNMSIPFEEDVLDVFASADTKIAALIDELEITCRPYVESTTPERNGQDVYPAIPDLTVIDAEWNMTQRVGPGGEDTAEEWQRRFAEEQGIPLDVLLKYEARRPGAQVPLRAAELGEEETRRLFEGEVKKATQILTGSVIKRLCAHGIQFEKSLPGRIKTAINYEWSRLHRKHENMTASDFQEKHRWLKKENETVRKGTVPQWLMNQLSRDAQSQGHQKTSKR